MGYIILALITWHEVIFQGPFANKMGNKYLSPSRVEL